jgi:hypothetical protein
VTSDGISTADWRRLHALAVEVANAGDDPSLDRRARQVLFEFLMDLRSRYGERPSILATEADYADRPEESKQLLVRAYDLAAANADTFNLKEISLSLAELHLTELRDIAEARRWLQLARQWLAPENKIDWDEYHAIDRAITSASG